MKNNNLFTYLLWGLLALFLAIVGYYACQKQKEKKLKEEQEKAELEQTLRDMGYASDSLADAGSSFSAGDSLAAKKSKPSVSKDGIEDDVPATKGAGTAAKSGKTAPTTTQQPATAAPKQPAKTTTTTSTTAKPTTTAKGVRGPGSGRWAVRAGTFSYMEGARRRLEEVIKLGYPNAEISKTSDGKAAVVVFRSNDKNAAIKVADKLEEKGVDAAVFDRKN